MKPKINEELIAAAVAAVVVAKRRVWADEVVDTLTKAGHPLPRPFYCVGMALLRAMERSLVTFDPHYGWAATSRGVRAAAAAAGGVGA